MAHPDLDELLNETISLADTLLRRQRGQFYPFAMSMSADGEIGIVGGDTGDEDPSPHDMIDLLEGALRAQAVAGEIRAAAICVDVTMTPPGEVKKTDALRIRLEHQGGAAFLAVLPYKRKWTGKFQYGDLLGSQGEPAVFG